MVLERLRGLWSRSLEVTDSVELAAQRMLTINVVDKTDVPAIPDQTFAPWVGVTTSFDKVIDSPLSLVDVSSDHNNASRRVDVNLESPFRGDNAVVVIIIEVSDVITVQMIQSKFTEGNGDFAWCAVSSSIKEDNCV